MPNLDTAIITEPQRIAATYLNARHSPLNVRAVKITFWGFMVPNLTGNLTGECPLTH